jgi:hypothetical protein
MNLISQERRTMAMSRNPNPARKRRRPRFDLENHLTKVEFISFRLALTAEFLLTIYRLIKIEGGW